MLIDVEDRGDYQFVRCSGILGSGIRSTSDETLHRLIESQKSRVLVDLSGVDRITTEAISVLVTWVSRANAKGSRVVFINASPFVQAVFDATKINKFFETADHFDQGLKQLLAE